VSLSQRFQVLKKNWKTSENLKFKLQVFSLSSGVFSASSVSMLSLSCSFSLRPPSLFSLYLSHSLWQRLLSSFSLFLCLCFSAWIMFSSSSFHRFVFLSQKKDYGDGFWAVFWSSISVHHYHIFFFTGFNWHLKRHAYEICRWSIHFCCGCLFFVVWSS